MQIVVPMSGFGERFRIAGYEVPKPLIEVDGKPIISHVISLFPGETDFTFICNQDHLDTPEYHMREILEREAPGSRIVGIPPHKLGPIFAVMQVVNLLDATEPVIINYADFFCLWDFENFKVRMRETNCEVAVPAYRGFHPHSGGTTNYAYIREDQFRVLEIREKQPFTDNKVEEYASSGTYYFKTAGLMKSMFESTIKENINVNGEYYVSSACNEAVKAGFQVAVYEVEHFMQWGTPSDFEEYCWWSDQFRIISEVNLEQESLGFPILVPAAGEGSRFSNSGYATPKPFLPVNGGSMIEAVVAYAGASETICVACRRSQIKGAILPDKWGIAFLEELSSGQASTTSQLVQHCDCLLEETAFMVLPSDTLISLDQSAIDDVNNQLGQGSAVVALVSSSSPRASMLNSEYGWLGLGPDGSVEATRIKSPMVPGDLQITGAFIFRSRGDFIKLFDYLLEKEMKVGGEYYLDSLVLCALELQKRPAATHVKLAISIGTPLEYESYLYWQKAFDLWPEHPYSISKDPFVKTNNEWH